MHGFLAAARCGTSDAYETMEMKHTVTLTENEAQVILAGLRLAVSYASELKQHSKAQLFDAALETLQAQLTAE